MPKKGLGKGLDSLIPDFYNEDFDSNSTQSLEDLLKDDEEEKVETPQKETKNIFEEIKEEKEDEENNEPSTQSAEVEEEVQEEEIEESDGTSEDLSSDDSVEESVQTSQEIKIHEEHVEEVKKIVDKNPRITLWSSRSSAVFRYLRKTEPEFSISKEASVLIDEAVSKKYPEIWALFDDY